MDLVGAIEKLITERGSASILRDHLALLRDQAKALETENAALKKQVSELEGLSKNLALQLADAKKASDRAARSKKRTTSGELMVDGILWAYTGDASTGKWPRFAPLCPCCHTELCVSDASPFLALEPQDHRVRYYCDFANCGKTELIFVGTAGDREEKAARHILREQREETA